MKVIYNVTNFKYFYCLTHLNKEIIYFVQVFVYLSCENESLNPTIIGKFHKNQYIEKNSYK